MDYQPGDQITSGGVVYTYNGDCWTYVYDPVPNGVSTTLTRKTAPIPDDEATILVNDQKEYDFRVLSGLAIGALYANTVKAG